VATALRAIHSDSARPWTVAELGSLAGLSRAAFVCRFTALVGQPPMTYLTWWRMTLAARDIRQGSEPLSTIARKAGYEYLREHRQRLG
jgi:AraC-like DNA-binding protein